MKAEEAGVSPKEFVDKVAGEVKAIADMMNTSYDKFIRTTDDYHEKQFRRFSKSYMSKGIFTKDTTKECTVHLVSHFSQNFS